MREIEKAKHQLDLIIRKSRVHLYKPIQIAEILFKHRENPDSFDLTDLESYRNLSKTWRNTVTRQLVGRVSTSSQKFQDNLFEENALPPSLIAVLAVENEKENNKGIVEAYIYNSFQTKIGTLTKITEYLSNSTPDEFQIEKFINLFTADPGLRRSIDKAYEITVYALFSTLVRRMKATITVKVDESELEILKEFEDFAEILLGVNSQLNEVTIPANLYRVGVTNAADRGIDMWANFGPAIQIKHLSLTEDVTEDIVSQIAADRIVIVCKSAEETMITRVLNQLGYSDRIQGIVTQDDLDNWYSKCFSDKHKNDMGMTLLKDLLREFHAEFPSTGSVFTDFLTERRYNNIDLTKFSEV